MVDTALCVGARIRLSLSAVGAGELVEDQVQVVELGVTPILWLGRPPYYGLAQVWT